MSYRDDDEKALLVGFMLFLAEHGWVTEPHAKQMWLVGEYQKERDDARAWGAAERA